MLLINKYIRLKHDGEILKKGDEAQITKQSSENGSFYAVTSDGRKEWLKKSDFILIIHPIEYPSEKKPVLKEECVNFLTKNGFHVYINTGFIFYSDKVKITIQDRVLTVFKWTEEYGKWENRFTITGYEDMPLEDFKMLMDLVGVVEQKEEFKTCVQIAEETYKNNHTHY